MKNFEDYKSNNRENNMKVAPKNKLKIDIENKIEEIKSKDKVIGLIVDVLFKCCKVSSHEKFLLDHMEDESNYYRTYINTQKAKTRAILESLSMIKINNLEEVLNLKLVVNKNGYESEGKWSLDVLVAYEELKFIVVVPYSKIKEWIELGELEEAKYNLRDSVKLNGKRLGKQQLVDQKLYVQLNELDESVGELLRIRNNK